MAAPVAWAVAAKAASDPTLRRIVAGAVVVVLIIPVTVVAIPVMLVLGFMTSIDPNSLYCAPEYRTVTNTAWTPATMTTQQQETAATIADAAASVSVEPQAVMAAVMAAFLATDMDTTDLATAHPTDDTPIGVYARTVRGGWGNVDDLADVTTATERILTGNGDRPGIMTDPKWEDKPAGAWMATLGMADKAPHDIADAESKARQWLDSTGTKPGNSSACGGAAGPVSSDQVELAIGLMAAYDEGRLNGADIQQIRDIAAGHSIADCGVDVRILQVLTIALQNFTTVVFSDINRRCTGIIAGAGTTSTHYTDGGGHAIDLTYLDGSLDGGLSESQSVSFIEILDPVMPSGARVGQSGCRAGVNTVNLVQFDDSCDHLHIDVGSTDVPLAVAN